MKNFAPLTNRESHKVPFERDGSFRFNYRLRRILYFVVFSVLAITFSNLSFATGDKLQIGGRLYYSVSDGVYELDLTTLQRRYVYKNPTMFGGQLASVGDGIFIASASSSYLLLIKDGSSQDLARGSHPTFVKKYSKVLYYSGHGISEPRPRLFSGELNNGKLDVSSIQQVDQGPFGVSETPLQISDHEVVYKRDGEFDHLYKFDFDTNSISKLPIKNCRPLVWRSSAHQVICSSVKDGGFFSTSIDGLEVIELPKLKGIALGLYLPSDKLLGSRPILTLHGEATELVAYDFDTKKIYQLVDHVPFRAGTAFWIP